MTIDSQISLPKLIELNWRIDIKNASHVVSGLSEPTVFLLFKILGCCNIY
jgi:hypothetical protein